MRLSRTAGLLLTACITLFSATARPVEAGPEVREPKRTAHGVLAGKTTIRWSGIKGMMDAPNRDFMLPPLERMRLYVRGGTYAYVALVPREQPPVNKCYFPLPKCEMIQLLYVHDFHAGTYKEGQEFLYTFKEPARVHPAGKPLELYLMTDGEATLVIKPKGLTGRSSYRATGRITGGVEELPVFCPTPGCGGEGYGGRYRVGGKTFDVGRLGFTAVVAFSAIPLDRSDLATGTVGYHNIAQLRTCRYPNPANWDASPESEDHPWGCDVIADPTNESDTRVVAFQTINQIGSGVPARGVLDFDSLHGLTGRQFVGYHAGSLGTSPATTLGYGIWYRYGVRR